MASTRFDWDADKDAANQQKHGISFARAQYAFADPQRVIATAAIDLLPGVDPAACRRPEIMADAAHWILTRPCRDVSGNFYIDEAVLAQAGVTDFDRYAVDPGRELLMDLFLD